MAEYIYHALDPNGQSVQGVLTAESDKQLDNLLQKQGYWVIEATKNTRKKPIKRQKIPRKELIDFFNGLYAMLSSGINVSDSIAAIADETSNESFTEVLRDLKLNVEAGNSMDHAMALHPNVFSDQIINLVRAGEYSGNLAELCADISQHLEWVDKIMSDIKQASIYPVLIFTAVMALVFLMFSFVVPRFNRIFISLDLELPMLTRAVVTIGEFTLNYWWLFLMIPLAIILFLKYAPQKMPAVGRYIDRIKIDLPVFGPLNRMIVLSRFCHNMALLSKAGVSILDALGLCKGLVGNRIMQLAVQEAEQSVNDGKRMSQALRRHDIVSPIVLRMMVVGEESGRLDEALEYASQRFDREIPRQIKRVFSILEPAIMLVLIMIVGLIGGAVFLPMFSLMSGVGG